MYKDYQNFESIFDSESALLMTITHGIEEAEVHQEILDELKNISKSSRGTIGKSNAHSRN